MKHLAFLLLLIFSSARANENLTEIYYKLYVSSDSQYYLVGQLESIIKRCIDRHLPSNFRRSYDEEAPVRFVVYASVMDVRNNAGQITGTIFSSHSSIRAYPSMFDDLTPEKLGLGVTAGEYDSEFIEDYISREVSIVFSEYDEIREAIFQYLKEYGN